METVIITDKYTSNGSHDMCIIYATHSAIDQHNKQFSCIGFVKLEKCTKGDSHVFLSHWISCNRSLIYTILKWSQLDIRIDFLFISFHSILFSFLASFWQSPIIRIRIEFNRIDNFSALKWVPLAHLTDCHFPKVWQIQIARVWENGKGNFNDDDDTFAERWMNIYVYSGSINRIFVARSIKIYHLKLRFTLYARMKFAHGFVFSTLRHFWSLFVRWWAHK